MAEDRPSRIAFLRTRLDAARRAEHPSTFDVPFRGHPITLPRIELRTDFPLYRIQSGRTHRAQSEYLDRHPQLPRDFFSDPEDPRVQAAQHEILLLLITERGLDKDLSERGQWTPVVLTYDGFVVDGNRRLCALREEGVEYVRAVVLPEDAENSEIYETEVELQMAAETKVPYNWMDEALHIRYGIEELGERAETVAERMRMDTPTVKQAIAQLGVVDMYLDWLGEPGKYHLIPAERGGTTQQAFRDLTGRLSSQAAQRIPREKQRALREACFSVIRAGGGYKDVRRIFDYLRDRPQDLLDRVGGAVSADICSPQQSITREVEAPISEVRGTQDELLLELAQSEPELASPPVTEILSMVSDPDRAGQIGPGLITAAEDLEAEEKEAKRLVQPLQRIHKALKELRAVELRPETQDLDEVARVLGELIELAEHLTTEIGRLRSESE